MHWLLKTSGIIGRLGRQVRRCTPLRTMTSNTGLSMSYRNEIAIIEMNKQDNRLNQDFVNIFHDFLDQVEGNPSIKGLITTGHGKFYSNGLDLDWMGTLPAGELVDFMKSFLHFMKRLLVFPVPTLACLNGHTFAGGAVMAYAHDFRVMNSEKGWVCLNEVLLKKLFFEFLTTLLRYKLGTGQNINDALIFGRRYTAVEALSSGLIHSKASQSELLEHSTNLLISYIGKDGVDRETLRNVKKHVYNDCLIMFDKHIDDIDFAKQFMTESQIAELENM